ncbi:MAG TPA: hypothetical protein ENI59_00455 [Euryarchaeota archaeon]|nr:hypothetical protein [Euryarchaeota archaeon]
MDLELSFAPKNGVFEWIKIRDNDLKSYLEDPLLPRYLVDKVKDVLRKYEACVKYYDYLKNISKNY